MSAPQKAPRPLSFFTGQNAPEVQPVRWIVTGFLALGAGTILFGQPGVSKTVHAAHLIAKLTVGQDFAGLETRTRGLRVLYLDFDGGWDWTASLFRAAFRGVGIEGLPESFAYYSPLTAACRDPEDPDAGMVALEALGQSIGLAVKEHRADLVVCDSLGQMMVGDSNSAQDVAVALRLGLNPARESGAAVLVIDHAAKAAVGNLGVPTPAGSQQKRAWARVTVALETEEVNGERLTRWSVDKSNAAHFDPFLTRAVFLNDHAGQLEVLRLECLGEAGPRGGSPARRIDEAREKVLDRLQDSPARRGDFPKSGTYDRAFKTLTDAGLIQKDGVGLYSVPSAEPQTSPEAAPPHHTLSFGAVVQDGGREVVSFDD